MTRPCMITVIWVSALVSALPTAGRSAPEAMGEETLILDEIPSVFGASKHEQKISEAPSSVTIVTAEEIERYGYRTLDDVVRGVRGFYVMDNRNFSYIGVRGLATLGDYNTRILLLVDGHRYNEIVYQSFPNAYDGPVDIEAVERIEIIRGPGSSLYGTNALFAVINIVTKRGRDLKGIDVEAHVGSHQSTKARLAYGDKLENDVEIVVSGSVLDRRGQDLYFEEFDSPETNHGVAEGIDAERSFLLATRVSWRRLSLNATLNHRRKQVPTASYETVFNDGREWTLDRHGHVELVYVDTWGDVFDLEARLHYGQYLFVGTYPYEYEYYESDEPGIVLNRDNAHGRWLGGELRLGAAWLPEQRTTLGLEIRQALAVSQRNRKPGETFLDDHRRPRWTGAYVQHQAEFLGLMALNAGLRLDWHDTFGATLNPRLAIILDPTEDSVIKLLLGRAFRAPNTYELYYHDGEYTSKAALDLDPEIIQSAELVLEHRRGRLLRGVVSAYGYSMENLITLTTDPSDDLLVYENGGEVRAFGVEVELEWSWDRFVDGRLSYAWQRAEDVDSKRRLINSPEHIGQLSLSVPIFGEALRLGVDGRALGRRRTRQGPPTRAHTILNLTLLSRDVASGLRISASVYNLLNVEYSDPAADIHVQNAIPQDGRALRLRLALSF